jgi:hypothetical protein
MKTPREILLERHQSATSKLDAIRQEVLAAELESIRRPAKGGRAFIPFASLPLKLWQELVLPYRRIWSVIATVWVAVIAINMATESGESWRIARSAAKPTPEVLAALKEQRLLMAQLLEPMSSPADRPKILPPHSELKVDFQTV